MITFYLADMQLSGFYIFLVVSSEHIVTSPTPLCRCQVTVNGMPFNTVAHNKKNSKLMAAEKAIQWLEETGVMQTRLEFLQEKR